LRGHDIPDAKCDCACAEGVTITLYSAFGKVCYPTQAVWLASRFVEADMAIHANAEKLYTETTTLEDGRPVSFCLEIRPACLPVNDQK
jgi:hypothetical protein